VKALIEALQAPTDLPLRGVLGGPVLDTVPLSERQADDRRRAAGGWLALQTFEIAPEAGGRATALFGEAHVPLPALLVQTPRGWVFDQAGTIEAMRKRRIGVNEANALEALRALAAAQSRYRLSERRADGVLEYARRIRSSGPGRLDGLTASGQEVVPGASTDLLNQAFGQAEGEPGNPRLMPLGRLARDRLRERWARQTQWRTDSRHLIGIELPPHLVPQPAPSPEDRADEIAPPAIP